MIEKPISRERIEGLSVAPATKSLLRAYPSYSRFLSHLVRLLGDGRSAAERRLGLALLDHQELIDGLPLVSRARDVVLGESRDTALWWTFAPYLLQRLEGSGLGGSEALSRILHWAQSGDASQFERVHLQGLTWLNSAGHAEMDRAFVLSPDPGHITHRFVAQEAEKLVREVPTLAESLAP